MAGSRPSTPRLHAIIASSMFKAIGIRSRRIRLAPCHVRALHRRLAPQLPRAPAPTVRSSPGNRSWDGWFAWRISAILRDPNPPAPVVLRAGDETEPALVAPPPPSDLIRLLERHGSARPSSCCAGGRARRPAGRRRAAHASADDEEVEVRQMAAFGLGLIADASARPALLKALDDPEPVVQGRAAEALGSIGDRTDADAIGAMVRRHVAAGAIAKIEPDDLSYPLIRRWKPRALVFTR